MEWQLQPGETILRKELHVDYGGKQQGGISPSGSTPNIMIFTDPEQGIPHGYLDRWEEGILHYTGEGQTGDQQMNHGNLQVLGHRQDQRILRVFQGSSGEVEYVGEFQLDDHPYYTSRAPESGNPSILRRVIIFRLRPSDPQSVSTPEAKRVQGHRPAAPETELGHLAVAELAGDGLAKGQGFRSSAKVRKVIEVHAMTAAQAHYESLGWELTDVSATQSYDFVARKDGQEKRLEVKGTTSAGLEVLLTPNEVAHARTYPNVALVICHSIELDTSKGEPVTNGGELEVHDPWRVEDGHLAPVGYAYTVPQPLDVPQ